MKIRTAASVWAVATVCLLSACGSGPQVGTAARSGPSPTTAPTVPATTALPSPTPELPAVPDFPVVAYQGDQAFGGHDGHFTAVFAAGRPVVLLYFAGL